MKVFVITVVSILAIYGLLKMIDHDREEMKQEQATALKTCHDMNGEAILTWDANGERFFITGCKVR